MKMDAQEEAMGSKEYTHIVKGKRTKRPRPTSPLALTMTCSGTTTSISSFTIPQLSNSSSIAGGVSDNNSGGPSLDPTNSVQFTQSITTTYEEEEDMANCLILLAQGQIPKSSKPEVVPTTKTTNKATGALYLYQCKTCNRCFPSFQALGGHRASHKKHNKATGEEKKPLASTMQEEEQEEDQINNIYSTTLSLQICNRVLSSSSNNKSRVHECSICGAEFMSGQALGGHMRRHRSIMPPLMGVRTTSSSISPAAESSSSSWSQLAAAKKPRRSSSTVLSLDLNLPAPEVDNDHREYSESIPNFTSASPLVDCHY